MDLLSIDSSAYSGIIISGGPTFLSQIDREEFLRSFQFIKTANLPVLGICLGHQIIGLLHGSLISHGEEIRKLEQIEVLQPSKLFDGVKNNSSFQEAHYEHITLPFGFQRIAKSNSCSNEAMKHLQQMIYSVQFHPEVSGNNGKMIFNNFLTICEENKQEKIFSTQSNVKISQEIDCATDPDAR